MIDFRFSGRTNKKRIIFHTIIAFALFAATNFWMVKNSDYLAGHRVANHWILLLLTPWAIAVSYLFIAYRLSKRGK
jgi:hypothetical protein